MNRKQQGFALLIAVIFMSVMLTFGLALGSLAYKQTVLSSNAVESQYAFYVADAALECALYADRQAGAFSPYPQSHPALASVAAIACGGSLISPNATAWNANVWTITYRMSIDSRCADVTIYKRSSSGPGTPGTDIYAQGYDVSCATVATPGSTRYVSRGLRAYY